MWTAFGICAVRMGSWCVARGLLRFGGLCFLTCGFPVLVLLLGAGASPPADASFGKLQANELQILGPEGLPAITLSANKGVASIAILDAKKGAPSVPRYTLVTRDGSIVQTLADGAGHTRWRVNVTKGGVVMTSQGGD